MIVPKPACRPSKHTMNMIRFQMKKYVVLLLAGCFCSLSLFASDPVVTFQTVNKRTDWAELVVKAGETTLTSGSAVPQGTVV